EDCRRVSGEALDRADGRRVQPTRHWHRAHADPQRGTGRMGIDWFGDRRASIPLGASQGLTLPTLIGGFLPEVLPEGICRLLPEGFRQAFRKPSARKPLAFPAMPRQGDTYTAAQAARILGVSERRVRQLVNERKLAGTRGDDGTVRLSQQAV